MRHRNEHATRHEFTIASPTGNATAIFVDKVSDTP